MGRPFPIRFELTEPPDRSDLMEARRAAREISRAIVVELEEEGGVFALVANEVPLDPHPPEGLERYRIPVVR